MWENKKPETESTDTQRPLKDAVREARIEAAERSGVVVDLRDAAVARLELLNEALDPLFRRTTTSNCSTAVARGHSRLWIDVTHVRWAATSSNSVRGHAMDAVLTESAEASSWWRQSAICRAQARRARQALADDAGRESRGQYCAAGIPVAHRPHFPARAGRRRGHAVCWPC